MAQLIVLSNPLPISMIHPQGIDHSKSASTATNMATWLRNVGRRRKRKQENVSNATKKSTLQRTIKRSSQ